MPNPKRKNLNPTPGVPGKQGIFRVRRCLHRQAERRSGSPDSRASKVDSGYWPYSERWLSGGSVGWTADRQRPSREGANRGTRWCVCRRRDRTKQVTHSRRMFVITTFYHGVQAGMVSSRAITCWFDLNPGPQTLNPTSTQGCRHREHLLARAADPLSVPRSPRQD